MSDFAFGDEDENEEQQEFDPKTSDNLKDVRDWGKKGWAQVKAAEKSLKELEELRAFKATAEKAQKATSAAEIFERMNLPKAQAKLFVAVSDEVSEEAVKKYATEFGLVPAAAAAEGTESDAGDRDLVATPVKKPEGFKPVTGQGNEGFVDGAVYSLDDIRKMLAGGDAARVEELSKKGKLGLEKLAGDYPTDNRQ
jgi:hypothetical protein